MSFSSSPKGTPHDRCRTRIFLLERGCSLYSVQFLPFGLPSAISCRNPYMEYGWTSYIRQCNDCLKFGNSWDSWGHRFVNFKLYSFNVKCSQNRVNLGTQFFLTILIQKLLTYCFFERIRWHFLFFFPLFFLRCLFGLPSVISCRNTYIEYGCTWCICRYNDCLKFGNSWGDPFVQVKLPS